MENKLLSRLFFLFLFIYMLFINMHMPLFADDYCDSQKFTGFHDLFNRVYEVWMTWGGRVVATFIMYLFLLKNTIGVQVFNVLNAFIFCALIYGIFLVACLRRPKNKDLPVLIFILALLWFSLDSIAEVAFWKVGSIVYLWSLTGTLFFIYPYEQILLGRVVFKDNFFTISFFIIAGLILGAGLENLSVAIAVFLVATLGYLYIHKKSIPKWAWLGMGAYLVGSFILLVAPGNYARALAISSAPNFVHENFFEKMLPFTGHMIKVMYIYYIFLFILLLVNFGLKYKKMFSIKPHLIFMVLGFLSAYAMMGAPGIFFGDRTAFVSSVFMIIAIIALLPKFDWPMPFYVKFLLFLILTIVTICLLSDMLATYKMYKNLYLQQLERNVLIETAIQQNVKNIRVPAFYVPSRNFNTYDSPTVIHHRNFFSDITKNAADWHNVCAARYYNISSVALQPIKTQTQK